MKIKTFEIDLEAVDYAALAPRDQQRAERAEPGSGRSRNLPDGTTELWVGEADPVHVATIAVRNLPLEPPVRRVVERDDTGDIAATREER